MQPPVEDTPTFDPDADRDAQGVDQQEQAEVVPALPVPRPRILVADDSALNRKLLVAILAKEECEVVEAEDGNAALYQARTTRPDLVLLDIMMPGKDGYQVCEELKGDPQFASIPIIVLSALTQPADKVKALELGAVDYVTKPFDRGEVLARVRNQLEIRRLTNSLIEANRALTSKQKELDADLAAAADIQTSLIPRSRPETDRVDVAWRFQPCSAIGGDIFNATLLDDHHLAISIVDVSGHGVPAAMVTVSVAQALTPQAGIVFEPRQRNQPLIDAGAPAIRAPAEVLTRLDEEFPMERFDKYFTMVYAVLDTRTGRLRFCNAAHPRPVVRRQDGSVELLEVGGTIVGLGGVMPFEEYELDLEPGDRLFLFTDGISEHMDADGQEFGEDRLRDLLRDTGHLGLQEACDRVESEVLRFGGDVKPNDDITVLGLEFLGPAGE